ncbi:MAG TPA: dienelactone hydrolase family protein [Candidatus Limnocylindria bacterium]|nr:dienelactone hydrolase family protein [Candidatus Limnocylindria bacterium]
MDGLNDTQRYFVEEHIEDYRDGLIARRELIRRVAIVVGSAAAATTLLAACDLSPRSTATTAPTGAVVSPTQGLVAQPFATPPPAPTTDGVTVKENDPRIAVSKPEIKSADGVSLMAYVAKPVASGRVPGVMVIHENRGQTEHIRDVVRRAATAGFVAVNIDLTARQGGGEKLGDAVTGAIGNLALQQKLDDHTAALAYLKANTSGAVGAVGFCFGGGEVWNLLAAGADLRAAAPYYGPQPSNYQDIGSKTKAATLAVYAEQDTRITSTGPQMEEQLKKAGVPYQISVFPGVNHAFHNDTGARYAPEAAQKAWVATIEWFRKYLA